MKKIIALCGRAGSGKTSVANHLVEKHGAVRVSFAGPLKKMAMRLWDFSPQQVYGDASIKETIDPRWGITPRVAMQTLGQAARDYLYEAVWIHAAFEEIERLDASLVVIEDLRYVNEANEVFKLGGTIIRLHCSDSISSDTGNHPSEAEVDLIPKSIVHRDIYGSRAEGLPPLFTVVDNVLAGLDG